VKNTFGGILKKIIPVLISLMCMSVCAQADILKPTPQIKPKFQAATPKLQSQIQPRVIKLNASKVRTQFGTHATSLTWSIDIINQGDAIIPPYTLEYKVSQTLNHTNPVLMLKGNVKEAIAVGQKIELTGYIKVGCAYDKIEVEIKDKLTGKVLVAAGSPMPVEPARGKVRVVEAKYRFKPKPAAPIVIYENVAKMPILVKAILYRIPVNSTGGYVKADERTIWLGSEDKKAVRYTGKVGAFDRIRIEISQESPVIHCPASGCVTFKTYEGDFVEGQTN
jgi:hypothetical protein